MLAEIIAPGRQFQFEAEAAVRTAQQAPPPKVEMYVTRRFTFRGAAARLQTCDEPEVCIAGPMETGKTLSALQRVDNLARTYPGAQGAILRKVQQDLWGTVVKEFRKHFERDGITHYGGEKPEWFDYPNGSRIWCGGLDRPGKFLSGGLDFVYVNQAEETVLSDAELLTTRTTGRAGNIPWGGQVIYDANPGPPHHWLKQRPLEFLESRHKDNPALWDETAQAWTAQGERVQATIAKLTGVRYKRLGLGLWVSAEGTVYEFDPAIHEIDPFPIPADWRRIRVVDFGYKNPFVCHWWAVDGDGRAYLYREIYMTGRTVRVHSEQINDLSVGERIEATVADHDAEDRATLQENGIPTIAANKSILLGIEKVQERLKVQGDGKPRLFVMRGCLVELDEALAEDEKRPPVNTRQEFDAYAYPRAADGKPVKEIPVDLYNHGMDNTRYLVMYLDGPQATGEWGDLAGLGQVDRFKSRWT